MSGHRSHTTLTRATGLVSRRVFVRGSFVGLAALGIGALSGRADAQYGSSAGATPGAGPGSGSGSGRRGTGRGKESKAAAQYQNRPRGVERCGRCAHFRPPNGCEIVEGSISPNGWCRHFRSGT
jgi:hypothetical protein